ncbi:MULTISPECIES: type II toxin-antitoxin system RelE/ParE family toxin [Protofrankia]|uniref:type II toxin-antitoxin system RelE/ParE family toxin n=1 Tax=Protofrankia TaxID=2994361 RepID=UPI0001C52C30
MIDLLADSPHPLLARQLVGGADEWRVRTGDHRIMYDIQDKEPIILVVAVGNSSLSVGPLSRRVFIWSMTKTSPCTATTLAVYGHNQGAAIVSHDRRFAQW